MPTQRPSRQNDRAEPVTVDVEVTEIDGVTHEAQPPAPERRARQPRTPGPDGRAGQGWRSGWAGRVHTLDSRWWPLWVVLGIIGVVLAVTVGLVLAVIYLTFRIIAGVIQWILGLVTGQAGGGLIGR